MNEKDPITEVAWERVVAQLNMTSSTLHKALTENTFTAPSCRDAEEYLGKRSIWEVSGSEDAVVERRVPGDGFGVTILT